MKTLIAIPSCHALRQQWHRVVRETWGKDSTADVRFFLGNPKGAPESDEVVLDVGDTLPDLTHKVVAMFKWALEQGYEYCFKVDLDTFVRPVHLLQSGYEQHDWVGGQNSFFASGGGGYGLSRRAMQIVVDYPINTTTEEDVHTARALLEKGIQLHHDPRYKFIPGQMLDGQEFTYHLSSVKAWGAKATPEELKAAYQGTFQLSQQQTAIRRFQRLRRP